MVKKAKEEFDSTPLAPGNLYQGAEFKAQSSAYAMEHVPNVYAQGQQQRNAGPASRPLSSTILGYKWHGEEKQHRISEGGVLTHASGVSTKDLGESRSTSC